MSNPYLENGEVTITGEIGGRQVKLNGNIEDCLIECEVKVDEDETYQHYADHYVLPPNTTYKLKFKTKDRGDVAYTYEVKDREVVNTAQISVATPTARAVEEARVAAGVPEDATFALSGGRLDGTNREVFFTWTEQV